MGGSGNDTYTVDDSRDLVIEEVGGGTDAIRSSISYALGAQVENLTLIGAGNINGTGNAFPNIIIGNTGKNLLIGGAGNDTLAARGGNDTLIGSDGDDVMLGGAGADVHNGGAGADRAQYNNSPVGLDSPICKPRQTTPVSPSATPTSRSRTCTAPTLPTICAGTQGPIRFGEPTATTSLWSQW